MPKLYYPTPDEVQGAVPLNENLWMREYQGLMLALANTSEGKDLLCIEDYGLPIIGIRKNAVLYDQGGNQLMADFRVGAKWGNVVRYRWQEVRRALDRMNLEILLALPNYFIHEGRVHPMMRGAATLTEYPDPHPETTTVDGYVARANVQDTWDAIHDGDGTEAFTAYTFFLAGFGSYGYLGSEWSRLRRSSLGFDTSPIGGGTISSATFSVVLTAAYNDLGGSSLALVLSSPASNTELATSDYQNGFGTTRLATDIAFASLTADSSTYNDFGLNSTGLAAINGTGVTNLGLRQGQDVDDTELTSGNGDNHVTGDSADHTGTSTDPKLVVVYTPAVSIPRAIMF